MPRPIPSFNPDVVFPLPVPPKTDFSGHNQTSFGWNRDGGNRKHAGIDLEAEANTPVLAMADGVVLRWNPYFYQGTGELEIEHPGIGIVRYGEVDPSRQIVCWFQRVKKGQMIAFVGKRKGATRSMLHLELYTDWTEIDLKSHPLSQSSNIPYQRRSDLIDPTALLRYAPLNKFGKFHHVTLVKSPFQDLIDKRKLENLMERARHISNFSQLVQSK